MAAHYHAIRQFRNLQHFKKGDVLVLFGELFNRGYANGLVEEAERRGMKIIRSTVGRREKDNTLRTLTNEELALQPGPVINIALEAGFDLEPSQNGGPSPVDQLKDVKLSEWEAAQMDVAAWQSSQKAGQARFRKAVQAWVTEVKKQIPPGSNVLFAHLMAGGVPRTKIVMPLMNRSLKGSGDRYLPSQRFWDSSIGQFVAASFLEVTAHTFDVLIHETTALRDQMKADGSRVAYLAYGYHGTEVLIGLNYTWQTYTPYLQGWAKMQLESFSHTWTSRGVTTCVYNCPEILTNSSSIFQGVEVSLYPLLAALQKETGSAARTLVTLKQCRDLLKPEHSFDDMKAFTDQYLGQAVIREHCQFERWPQHAHQEQLELMLKSSDHLIDMHLDPKQLITAVLSEVVFASCGRVMLGDISQPESPVSWLNHDVLAKVHGA